MKRLLLAILFTSACTPRPEKIPDELKYREDTELMLNVVNKFTSEQDIKKLHVISKSVQDTRAIACFDYFGECNIFGKYLSLTIEVSRDGVMSAAERESITTKTRELRKSIEQGREKIRSAKKSGKT